MVDYANTVYLMALKRFSLDSSLMFDYSLFLEYFCKKKKKAAQLLMECRMRHRYGSLSFVVNLKMQTRQLEKEINSLRERRSGNSLKKRMKSPSKHSGMCRNASKVNVSSFNNSICESVGDDYSSQAVLTTEHKVDGSCIQPNESAAISNSDAFETGVMDRSSKPNDTDFLILKEIEVNQEREQESVFNDEDEDDDDDYDMNTLALKTKIAVTQDEHEHALRGVQMFWQIALNQNPFDLKIIPEQLAAVNKAADRAKKGYEEILSSDPMSVKVLCGYAQLLQGVFFDDAASEVVMARVAQAEEEGYGHNDSADPSAVADADDSKLPNALSATMSHSSLSKSSANYSLIARRQSNGRKKKHKRSAVHIDEETINELSGKNEIRDITSIYIIVVAAITILLCGAFGGTMMLFYSFANNHVNELISLHRICTLLSSVNEMSMCSMFLYIHSTQNFVNQTVESPTLHSIPTLTKRLVELANSVEVSFLIFSAIADLTPWESAYLNLQTFYVVSSTSSQQSSNSAISP